MNNIKFNQTGGFPLSTNRLNDLQEAYQTLQTFGSCIGNKSIIQGCFISGNLISNGYLFIDGELLEFRESAKTEGILIKEITDTLEYENGEEKETLYERYAIGAGNSPDTILWTEFTRPNTLLELSKKVAELEIWTAPFKGEGSLVFWNKPANTIPSGWKEAVDWRGRMPVGLDPRPNDFDFGEIGKTGGSKIKTLIKSEIPAITGEIEIIHPYVGEDIGGGFKGGDNRFKKQKAIINNQGGGKSFSLMNPYRVVLFIERDI